MSGRFRLVADDYGLSPAVSAGIRSLLAGGRLSGTGCMTLFPEWSGEASLLRDLSGVEGADIGLHLTLTDFPGLTGWDVDGGGRMPALPSLIAVLATSRRHDEAISKELDAQLEAFENAWGRAPAYLDGHQHVHFLRPVRRWLAARAGRFASRGAMPWVRGAPQASLAGNAAMKAKVAFVRLLARGFEKAATASGYGVCGPLAGFYDWRQPDQFAEALAGWVAKAPDGAVIMCHPGKVDDMLRARDGLVDAREIELEVLQSRPPLSLRRGQP